MATMRAARFDPATRRLAVTDVPVPDPAYGEVLVRVKACGICLSDVHLLDGSLRSTLPELTPGHEAAGVIERVGDGVLSWRPGQRVVMAGGKPCGQCAACVRGGADGDCLRFQVMGFDFDGAWAEYVVVPHESCTVIPDALPFEQAAILADAVSTPFAGLTVRAGLRPGEAVGLWGIGGLGTHAVQIARIVGASPIIAVDPNARARQRALELGADHAIDPTSTDVREQVLALTGGLGLDVAVDLVGANAVLSQGAACLGRHGRLLMIGLSLDPIRLGPGVLFGVGSQSLLGHLGYAKRDLDRLVDIVAAGRLDVSRSVSGTVPLEDVSEGVRRLAAKEGDPVRLLVIP